MKNYNPQEREKYWQTFWEEQSVFVFNPEDDKPEYTIDTPPPTISGSLHLGHIFSYTQAEIIARYKKLAGFNVRYPFGFDNNGLPTERLTEKEKGVLGRDMPLPDFIQLCLEVTNKYGEEFADLWKSVGMSYDWDLVYSSISPDVQKIAQQTFLDLYSRGIAYTDGSPTLYCVECRTAVAQAEVEDKEKDSVFYDLQFTIEETGETLPIATTRPELVPACVAVFVHPDDERFAQLVGKKVKTPLGVSVNIMTDDKVAMDKGTGAVMCCTYGDETDRYWVKKHGLNERVIISDEGIIQNSILDEQNGKTISEARDIVVKKLKSENLILEEKAITHTVGVHERCGTPMELISTQQWLVKILDQKEVLLKLGEQINWYPAFMYTRYKDWVENLKWDWNISRDRYFGIPIPVFHAEDGSIITADPEDLPIDPRSEEMIQKYSEKTGKQLKPEMQILDTWFTSSLTPEINDQHERNGSIKGTMHPMSMRPMAHDIIRTWGVYTILMTIYRKQEIPWNDLMISGHVLLKKGEKISKKTGGGKFKPQDLITEHSADAVRYAMAGSSLGKDGYYDEGEVQKGKKLITKLYNASKFALMHIHDYDAKSQAPLTELMDEWIVARAGETARMMKKHFDAYEYGKARITFEEFFWSEFTDNYLEIVKGRLYNADPESEQKKSAQSALYTVCQTILILATPFIPHITEEIFHLDAKENGEGKLDFSTEAGAGYFARNAGTESVNQLTWPTVLHELGADKEKATQLFLDILDKNRQFRSDNSLSLGKDMQGMTVTGENVEDTLGSAVKDLKAVCKAQAITYEDAAEITVSLSE